MRNGLRSTWNLPKGLTGGGDITNNLMPGFLIILLAISNALVAVPFTSGGK